MDVFVNNKAFQLMNTSSVILLCHLPSHTFLWIKKTGSMVINKSLFLLTVYKEFFSFSSLFSYKIKEERRSMRLFTPMLNEDQSQIHATHLDLFFPSPLIIYFGLICWRSIASQCPAGVILPFTFFFFINKSAGLFFISGSVHSALYSFPKQLVRHLNSNHPWFSIHLFLVQHVQSLYMKLLPLNSIFTWIQ
jgi:hypothetical protein